jgi:hypothetical protein
MGLFSKLFGSTPPPTSDDEAKGPSAPPAELIPTPQATPAIPAAARPTPIDVHERATVPRIDALLVGERPTVEMPLPVPKAAPKAPPAPAPKAPPAPASKPKAPPPAPASKPKAPPPLPTPPTADDLDAGFAAIERKSDRPAKPGTFEVDLAELRQLFGRIAANHMRQVRDFIIELRWGPAPTTWIAVCESSVHSLRRAADGLAFTALAAKLNDFAKALLAQELVFATTIDGVARDRILAAHGELATILPETFALDGDRSEREAAILHSLLAQIPDVGKVTIDKLYAAGLTTLGTMMLATADDLAATTGIVPVLAARIVARFHLYREETRAASVDETRAYERGKIASLVVQLRTQNEELARAAEAWTEEALQRKKEVLLARTQSMIAIDLQLARLGEVALVRELERLSFARKLEELEGFLGRAHYAAAPAAK